MLSFIKFGDQIGGIIHMLASDFRRYPHGVDITEFQAKGKSGKELIYPEISYIPCLLALSNPNWEVY